MLVRFVVMILLSLPTVLLADTLRLGGMDRCPYICVSDQQRPGYMLEIAQEVFSRAGHTVEFEPLPWSRALRYVRGDHLDGIVGVLRRNAPDLLYPKQAQAVSRFAFFVPASSDWRYSGLVSLWQVQIGVTQDVSYGSMDSYIERYRDSPRIQSLAGEAAVSQNLRAMARERIDVLLADRAVIDYHRHKDSADEVLKEAGVLHAEYLYIAFAPSSLQAPEYAQILSEGIDRLRSDGTLAAILLRYGLSDWQPE
ncbi:MAG: transporter substrate-binding domain-containing protein [Motiliproteus sp.]